MAEWFCSSVTGGTTLQRLNLPIVHELFAVLFLHFSGNLRVVVPLPVQVGDLVGRTHPRGGIAMAIEAESHAQRFGMINLVHLVDLAMALDTTDAAVDVDGMVEIHVVGRLVNMDPRNRLARRRSLSHQSQLRTVLPHLAAA